jgi:two-component system CheB/CheR fusion protein
MPHEREDMNGEALLSPDRPELGAHPAPCPVVGASAGGLEAFQNFLYAAPADSGFAYALVQHLDPNHESMLAELLSRRTQMPVRQITHGMVIEPNNVYLIPPNASLEIENARHMLTEFSEPRGFRRSYRHFLPQLGARPRTERGLHRLVRHRRRRQRGPARHQGSGRAHLGAGARQRKI